MNTSPEPKFTLPKLAAAAANEGIPVAAIARILSHPLDEVYEVLKEERSIGNIVALPRADWPPGTKINDRLPHAALPSDAELGFLCTKTFRLTQLEAGFLVALLKNRQVEKTRLHGIVEHQRNTRPNTPQELEATDPKMVDVMICKLRKKLKTVDEALKIETIWGIGYYLEVHMKPRIIAHLNGETYAPPAEGTPAGTAVPSQVGTPAA